MTPKTRLFEAPLLTCQGGSLTSRLPSTCRPLTLNAVRAQSDTHEAQGITSRLSRILSSFQLTYAWRVPPFAHISPLNGSFENT